MPHPAGGQNASTTDRCRGKEPAHENHHSLCRSPAAYLLLPYAINSLKKFLGKLEKYKQTHRPKTAWTMPVVKQEPLPAPMPPKLAGYKADPETLYFYATGQVVNMAGNAVPHRQL